MTTAPADVWRRNLVVLGAGQLVAISAMGIVIPLIPFFLRELGMTDRAELERWSGLVFSGPFLAAALMSPVWAALGDRYLADLRRPHQRVRGRPHADHRDHDPNRQQASEQSVACYLVQGASKEGPSRHVVASFARHHGSARTDESMAG